MSLASAAVVAALGATLLGLRPRRDDQMAFGLFALSWAGVVFFSNLGTHLDDPGIHRNSFLLGLALAPATTLFLAYFGDTIGRRSWTRGATVIAGVVGLVATGLVILRPELAVRPIDVDGVRVDVALGPAAFPLFHGPLFIAFTVVLLAAYQAWRRAPAGTARHRVRGIVLALGLLTSYQLVRNLSIYLPLDPTPLLPWLAGYQALFVGATVVTAGIVAHMVARPPPPEDVDKVLVAAFAVPAAFAVGEYALELLQGEFVYTWGVWRLLAVAAVVYHIARYQLFDLDQRLRRLATPVAAAMLVAFGALMTFDRVGAGHAFGPASVPLAAGLVGAAVTVAAGPKLQGRLFPGVDAGDPDYTRHRQLEVYAAALERVLADGHPEPVEADVLQRLRGSLDVSMADHDRLVARVNASGGATAPRAAPQRSTSRYRFDRLLGEGGHGRAHLAFDKEEGREVVVKVVGKAALGGRGAELLAREAEVLGALDHPNIVRLHELVETEHELWLVEEYCAGGNLHALMQRRGRLAVRETLEVLDQLLAALAVAHEHGVVHGDVKPENVLVAGDGTVRLADFGVSRQLSGTGTQIAAGPLGTLHYMSPEQVRGGPGDERSDLYAVAVLAVQLLTGRFYLPVTGRDDFQVRRLILEGEPRLDRADVPAPLRAALVRALAKDARDRFQDAKAMRQALQANGAQESRTAGTEAAAAAR